MPDYELESYFPRSCGKEQYLLIPLAGVCSYNNRYLLGSSDSIFYAHLKSRFYFLCSFEISSKGSERMRREHHAPATLSLKVGTMAPETKLPQMKLASSDSATATLLENLRSGRAFFEILRPKDSQSCGRAFQFASISSYFAPSASAVDNCQKSSRFFARISQSSQFVPSVSKKPEYYSVQKVHGDGRCMFRSLVKGMAANKGITLGAREEEKDADELRMAVKEALCTSAEKQMLYEEAIVAVTVEESLKGYCRRIEHPSFWGGEAELLVLSRMCSQPVIVYIPASEAKRGTGTGFIAIAEYGREFMKGNKSKARKPVRLLYSGSNHYDLLI